MAGLSLPFPPRIGPFLQNLLVDPGHGLCSDLDSGKFRHPRRSLTNRAPKIGLRITFLPHVAYIDPPPPVSEISLTPVCRSEGGPPDLRILPFA